MQKLELFPFSDLIPDPLPLSPPCLLVGLLKLEEIYRMTWLVSYSLPNSELRLFELPFSLYLQAALNTETYATFDSTKTKKY